MRSKTKLPDNWKPCVVVQPSWPKNCYELNKVKTVIKKWGAKDLAVDNIFTFLSLHANSPTKQVKKGKLPENWMPVDNTIYQLYVEDWTEYDTHEKIETDRELYSESDYLKDRLFYMLYRNVKLD
jgi:hypothetical protein